MTVVLADDEERRLDEEPEVAVLEGTSVPLADQEANQPFVALGKLVRLLVEGDARTVHDREVGGEGSVEGEEALVQDVDGGVGQRGLLYY